MIIKNLLEEYDKILKDSKTDLYTLKKCFVAVWKMFSPSNKHDQKYLNQLRDMYIEITDLADSKPEIDKNLDEEFDKIEKEYSYSKRTNIHRFKGY